MINKLKELFNHLFRRDQSVEDILAPFTKVQTKLEVHRQAQLDRAQKDHERSARIEAKARQVELKAQAEEAEAERAAAAAEKVAKFFA